jgi:hypothetical protein
MSDIVYYGTSTPSTKGDGQVSVACCICNEPLGPIDQDKFPQHKCDFDGDHQDTSASGEVHVNQGTIQRRQSVSSITGTGTVFKLGYD